jgi:hypothetical protein
LDSGSKVERDRGSAKTKHIFHLTFSILRHILFAWRMLCMGKYIIKKGVPVPSSARGGLSATIRRMSYGDCIVIPLEQYMSVHTCARSVGAKVRTQSNKDGTVNVWRIDSPPAAEVGPGAAATKPEPAASPQSSKESSTFSWPDWDSVKTIFD